MIVHHAGEVAPKDLRLDATLDAARAAVWRCWREPALLKEWYCPKPWRVDSIDAVYEPGGRFNSVFAGPNGERFENVGCLIEIETGRKLVFTDGYTEGFTPAEKHFMAGYLELSDAPDGKTRMIWGARHATQEDTKKHLDMGFVEGWKAAALQLEALAAHLD
ncbi:MAG: polyketide cyclase [Alphaproteobacteria bacterium RIFCSPHIGHO2_12_FULL_63_12]|nr:MAG: polyketide cyclase [Alphaproteobacteria bacterium RIFCSPHIGHO2_12_FULL_63_12]